MHFHDELDDFFLKTPDDDYKEEVEAAWHNDVRRRMEEIRAGRVVGKPAAQVFAEVRERYTVRGPN